MTLQRWAEYKWTNEDSDDDDDDGDDDNDDDGDDDDVLDARTAICPCSGLNAPDAQDFRLMHADVNDDDVDDDDDDD